MFNGFAFAGPLCEAIKVNLIGAGLGRQARDAGGTDRDLRRRAGGILGTAPRMGSINRYIVRTTLVAFLIVLVSLTAVIWVTQALRDIDIMTSQGQTILVFIGLTGLIIPLLVLVIAPIALVIAAAHILNKLSTDSEIIVMNSAGMSPWRLFRGFFVVSIIVSLLVTVISAYLAPKGLRMLHEWLTEVHANVVANIVVPGRFTTIEQGVTLYIRSRERNGQLVGIFLDDQRNPQQGVTVLAQSGEVIENKEGTFLVLSKGNMQRHEVGRPDPKMVSFDRYGFDLSQYVGGPAAIKYGIRERYLWQLLFPDPKEPMYIEQPGQFRAELHDRLMAPLYPIAFVIIAFAYLGAPRTNRQSRAMSLLGAVGGVALLRLIGFASIVFGANQPWMLSLQYMALALTFGLGLYVISSGLILEPPAFLTNAIDALSRHLSRRFASG